MLPWCKRASGGSYNWWLGNSSYFTWEGVNWCKVQKIKKRAHEKWNVYTLIIPTSVKQQQLVEFTSIWTNLLRVISEYLLNLVAKFSSNFTTELMPLFFFLFFLLLLNYCHHYYYHYHYFYYLYIFKIQWF